MIRYKIDVIEELKKKGYTTTRIRNERILSEATLTNIRRNKPITTATLDIICSILKKQPGQIIEYIPDTNQDKN